MKIETFNAKCVDKKEVLDINESTLLGSYSIFYFYPKNNTPGCTTEACDFSNFNDRILDLNCKIFGVSSDSLESHKKFQEKHTLTFPLISDKDREVALAFGLIKRINPLTKLLVNSKRETYLINDNLEIIKIWKKVNPIGHAQDVFNYLKGLHQ